MSNIANTKNKLVSENLDLHKSQRTMKTVFSGVELAPGLFIKNPVTKVEVQIKDIRVSNLLGKEKIMIWFEVKGASKKMKMSVDDFMDFLVEEGL